MNTYDLKEPVDHGTKEFPIKIYHATRLFASYHWHEECEFIYIKSGSAFIRIGIENLELKEGQCAFVKPNTLHSISSEDKDCLDFYAVVFHPSFLFSNIDICNRYLSPKYNINNCFSPIEKENYVIETIKLICNTYEEKPFAYELKIKSNLYIIFSYIFEAGLFNTNTITENTTSIIKLENVIQYIHKNYNTNITVDELARVSGYSISHFTYFFKEITGRTPIEYINLHRIYIACDFLKKTNLNVLEISLECGFENVGYFIKTFKRYIGYTPYKYKLRYFSKERSN
ncbi:MAG: AraC family transcriptional regulator [Anaerocolumna sp.]|jgi:AraC-like DNA-binding protein/mannose-6-phosphate isomerase-like protein (cupin superfamily)|nr:AraC family transcriptional regulator [Anaerocolumna sp.]